MSSNNYAEGFRGFVPRSSLPNQRVQSYFLENDAWVRETAAAAIGSDAGDEYWLAVGQVLAQVDGIRAGVNEWSDCAQSGAEFEPLGYLDWLFVQADGDLYDVQLAFPDAVSVGDADDRVSDRAGDVREDDDGAAPRALSRLESSSGGDGQTYGERIISEEADVRRRVDGSTSRCSAFFKVAPGARDIFFGHTTWDIYATAAPRTFKHVSLPVRLSGTTVRHRVSFSSSPGLVASVDDYHVTAGNANLAVIETSLNVYNRSAYHPWVQPRGTLQSWVRVPVANRLARSGADWASLVQRYKSGTYNNQWMVLDARKLPAKARNITEEQTAAASAHDGKDEGAGETAATTGLFWVVEEAPGLTHAQDLTTTLLNDGYWASYNVGYFDDVRQHLNDTDSYAECPRGKIFAALQVSVRH